MTGNNRLIIGISGASGVIYGIRLLEVLRQDPLIETHLIMTKAAKLTLRLETDYSIQEVEKIADYVYADSDISASIASGSYQTMGMIVAPCSITTMASIAYSITDSLLVRAADVVQKEGRKLVLLVRETPLHAGHLQGLHELALRGVIIMPPVPAFYTRPKTLDDLINQTVGRTLDLFGIEHDLVKRWEGPPQTTPLD